MTSQVSIEHLEWCDFYRGRKTDLIAVGVAEEGEFPGDPGRTRLTCSYSRNGETFVRRAGQLSSWRQIRKESRGQFSVRVCVPEDERSRRAAERSLLEQQRRPLPLPASIEGSDATQLEPMTPEYFAARYGPKWWDGSAWYREMEPEVWGNGIESRGVLDQMTLFMAAPLSTELTRRHVWNERVSPALRAVREVFSDPGPFAFRLSDEEAQELEVALATIEGLVAGAALVRDDSLFRRVDRFNRVRLASDALRAASKDGALQDFLSSVTTQTRGKRRKEVG